MNKYQSRKSLGIFNLVVFIGTVIVNSLAMTMPLNNKTTGELSGQYPNLFVPAGSTFSIWGVIYLLLAIFAIYQLVYAFRTNEQSPTFIEKIGILFILSSLMNMCWIFAWHYEMIPLSVLIMLILLLSLIAIYVRLGIGRADTSKTEKYLVHLPFSVYLGWITIATIANITALLVDINWNRFGFSEPFWTVAVLVVGIAIGLVMLFSRKDIFFALVVDWALFGIWIKRSSVEAEPVQSIILTVIIGISLISLGIVTQLIRRKVY